MAAIAMMAGCSGGDAEIFGRTYDQCILKNARAGGDQESRFVATEICARHFQRQTTPAERSRNISAARRVSYGEQNYLDNTVEDLLKITVRNSRDDWLITEVSVVADFSDKPEGPDGKFPADAKISTLDWTFNVELGPNGQRELIGSFDNGRAPTRHVQMDAYPTKIVPFAERR
jgi:hypothetical protein